MDKLSLKIEKGAVHKITVPADTAKIISSATVWNTYKDREPTLNAVLAAGSELLLGPYLNIATFNIDSLGGVTIEQIGEDFSTPVLSLTHLITSLTDFTMNDLTANEIATSGDVQTAVGKGFDIGTEKMLRYVDKAISSAEILALHSTPITIVAAQGANTVIQLVSVVLFLDYNAAAYAGIAAGDDLSINYTDASGSLVAGIETTGFLDQTNDEYRSAAASYAPILSDITADINAPLTINLADAIITGDSPMGVRSYYSVTDLTTLSAT